MSKRAGIRCFLCCCSGFLPKKDNEGNDDEGSDYYVRLGITKDATYEEIRKAYKRKSLRCHPDKIAQRGGDTEEAAGEFQRLKEAYDVLSDSDKRELYDAVGAEAMVYLTNPNSLDPMNMYENLTESPLSDKCKIFSLVLLFYAFLFIQPILICLKVDGDLGDDVKWVYVMIPFWIFSVFNLLALTFRYGRSVNIQQPKTKQLYKGAHLLQSMCIVLTTLFLALKLDENIDWDYLMVLSPLLVYEWLQLTIAVTMLSKSVRDVDRMISLPQLEKEIGRLYSDLSAEEKDEVNRVYIIVHPPPAAGDLDSQASAYYNVENTMEYQNALRKQTKAYKILFTVIIHSIFLGLLIPKLDKYEGDWNWWLVFTPIWVIYLFLLGGRCVTICKAGDESEEEEEASTEADDDIEQQKQEKANLVGEQNKQPTMNTRAQSTEYDNNANIFPPDTIDNNNTLNHAQSCSAEPLRTHATNHEDEEKEDLLGNATKKERSASANNVDDEIPSYAETEDSMNVDEQTEAAGTCCPLLFLITVSCLFVGKLQGGEFSSFWILFPVFFVAGWILCCCSCIIFCTPDYDDDEPQPVSNNTDDTKLLHAR